MFNFVDCEVKIFVLITPLYILVKLFYRVVEIYLNVMWVF